MSASADTEVDMLVRDIRRHDLPRRQVFIMCVFLSMVHAVVEDSLVFLALIPFSLMALFWIVVYRIAWAALVTLALTAVAGFLVRRARR